MSEPLFKDFQEQAFEDSEVFFSDQKGKCPRSTLHLLYSYQFYRIRKCMIGVSLRHLC
jgi:hypothetical protein